jgi:hypothetical protein
MQSLLFVCRDNLLNETYREEMKKESVELRKIQTIFGSTTERIGGEMLVLRRELRFCLNKSVFQGFSLEYLYLEANPSKARPSFNSNFLIRSER